MPVRAGEYRHRPYGPFIRRSGSHIDRDKLADSGVPLHQAVIG